MKLWVWDVMGLLDGIEKCSFMVELILCEFSLVWLKPLLMWSEWYVGELCV